MVSPAPPPSSILCDTNVISETEGHTQLENWEDRLCEGWLPRLESCLHYIKVLQPGLARVMLQSFCARGIIGHGFMKINPCMVPWNLPATFSNQGQPASVASVSPGS